MSSNYNLLQMGKIAIYGAGGFGREVKTLIDAINLKCPNTFELIGFFDDDKVIGEVINGLPIIGGIKELNSFEGELALAISVAEAKIKEKILHKIVKQDVTYPNIIHPNTSISKDEVQIGIGNIICEGVIITCNITIDNFVILNLQCTVGHDTHISSYSSFMPSVNISGEVEISEGVYVGTGAKIINQLTIGAYTIVGAGAVVAKSLPAHCTAVGIPAKVIKEHVF